MSTAIATPIEELRKILEREDDVQRVIKLSQNGGRFRYLIETPFATWPKYVIGTTDATGEDSRILFQSGLLETAEEEWASIKTEPVEIMLRAPGSPYAHGSRSANLLKYKPFNSDEAVMVGSEPGEGRTNKMRNPKQPPVTSASQSGVPAVKDFSPSTCSEIFLALESNETLTIIPGRLYPVLAIDLRWTMRGWMSSMVCNADRGGCEIWRGPYPSKISAARNAAFFGRDFLRAIGLPKMVDAISRFFNAERSHDDRA